jgi:hypothetical protein
MMNETRKQGQRLPVGKRRQHRWNHSQQQIQGYGNNSSVPATDTHVPLTGLPVSQTESSRLRPYVPPYRLRSPEENAIIGRSVLDDLPQPHGKIEIAMDAPRIRISQPYYQQGESGTGNDTMFSAQEEDGHVRMLAWENWALRNILMYRFSLSRQEIDFALDVEKQKRATGGR